MSWEIEPLDKPQAKPTWFDRAITHYPKVDPATAEFMTSGWVVFTLVLAGLGAMVGVVNLTNYLFS